MYKSSPIDKGTKETYKLDILNYMENKKPYLDPEITLEGIANDLSIPPRILSRVINDSFKSNFNCYLNEYRIQESIRQLSDTDNKKTILEIL